MNPAMECVILFAAMNHQNLHVPLPADLHSELRAESERSGQPLTELAREAIRALLRKRKRDCIHRDIAAYAATVAGVDDLDPALEEASAEHLIEVDAESEAG